MGVCGNYRNYKNCFCNIKFNNKSINVIGFFCKIPFPDKQNLLSVLIINNKILQNDVFTIGKNIHFEFFGDNESINHTLEIDESRKIYTNDIITIIEIKKTDKLSIDYFLKIDDELFKDNLNKININQKVLILNIGSKNKIFSGKIVEINKEKYYFTYTCSTKPIYLGIPIMNMSNNKVLGINIESKKDNNLNIGAFIHKPIEDFYKNNYQTNKIYSDKRPSSNIIYANNKLLNNSKNIYNKENLQDENFVVYKEKTQENLKKLQNDEIIVESNNKEGKEINLIFNIMGKELYLDVNEYSRFNEVISQLNRKYLWLKFTTNIVFEIDGKIISKNTTVKEKGLKDSYIIKIIEK